MRGSQHIVHHRKAPPSLRAAPASLTPAVADQFVALADRLCAIREAAHREATEAGNRRAEARFITFGQPLASRPAPSPGFAAELTRLRLSDQRPIAQNREPCGRCGTRGDIGCKHQRPMEPR